MKLNAAIINRMKDKNNMRFYAGMAMSGNIIVSCGSYGFIFHEIPENFGDYNGSGDSRIDSLDRVLSDNISALDLYDSVSLEIPDLATLKAFNKSLKKERKNVYNFGSGLPCVNAQIIIDVLTIDKKTTFFAFPGMLDHAIIAKSEKFTAVIMPVSKKRIDDPDKITDLTKYKPMPKHHENVWYLDESETIETMSFSDYAKTTDPIDEDYKESENEIDEIRSKKVGNMYEIKQILKLDGLKTNTGKQAYFLIIDGSGSDCYKCVDRFDSVKSARKWLENYKKWSYSAKIVTSKKLICGYLDEKPIEFTHVTSYEELIAIRKYLDRHNEKISKLTQQVIQNVDTESVKNACNNAIQEA